MMIKWFELEGTCKDHLVQHPAMSRDIFGSNRIWNQDAKEMMEASVTETPRTAGSRSQAAPARFSGCARAPPWAQSCAGTALTVRLRSYPAPGEKPGLCGVLSHRRESRHLEKRLCPVWKLEITCHCEHFHVGHSWKKPRMMDWMDSTQSQFKSWFIFCKTD